MKPVPSGLRGAAQRPAAEAVERQARAVIAAQLPHATAALLAAAPADRPARFAGLLAIADLSSRESPPEVAGPIRRARDAVLTLGEASRQADLAWRKAKARLEFDAEAALP